MMKTTLDVDENEPPRGGLVSTLLAALAFTSASTPASAQPIVSPNAPGYVAGTTLLANYDSFLDFLYQETATKKVTQRVLVGGVWVQAPPYFDYANSSPDKDCTSAWLHNGNGFGDPIPSPDFSTYIVNGDELSELAVVTSLGSRDDRMMEVHNTFVRMRLASGLPCWVARMSPAGITCQLRDSASDVTARLGLAYYQAAANLRFPTSSRAIYLAEANRLAELHLAKEYVHEARRSLLTGRTISHWIGGGTNTAAGPLENMVMWSGYHQDVARFLLAAFRATGDTRYRDRADDVVEQWLIANEFDGQHLSFGWKYFKWNIAVDPIRPLGQPPNQPQEWDDSDAPRSLWIGDVLRARALSSGVPFTASYSSLGTWIDLLMATGTQDGGNSCIQYHRNGTSFAYCGDDYYYNGLGLGLLTTNWSARFRTKLDVAFSRFGWTSTHTFDFAPCLYLYKAVRPLKALATGMALDRDVYAGASPCVSTSSNLCLQAGRFAVRIAWQNQYAGTAGTGVAVPLTTDTGYFWFFDPGNVEVVVKILDGTATNGKIWVFYGALSDVGYTITVEDKVSGAVKTYVNAPGHLASVADTSAF